MKNNISVNLDAALIKTLSYEIRLRLREPKINFNRIDECLDSISNSAERLGNLLTTIGVGKNDIN
jgi:hypothetical protein